MLVGTRSRKFIEFKELRYRYAALFEPWYWVNCGVAVWVDLKVQVGSGGEAKVAHACNLLASVNSLANGNIKSFHVRSEEHTSELQSRGHLVCRLLLEKKKHLCNKNTN